MWSTESPSVCLDFHLLVFTINLECQIWLSFRSRHVLNLDYLNLMSIEFNYSLYPTSHIRLLLKLYLILPWQKKNLIEHVDVYLRSDLKNLFLFVSSRRGESRCSSDFDNIMRNICFFDPPDKHTIIFMIQTLIYIQCELNY